MIMPVFTTTPIHAMQIELGIPPLQIWLDHMKQWAAAWIVARTNSRNPIQEHLPAQLQQDTNRHDATPLPLPIKPVRRKLGMLNKFRESMIHEIMKETPRNLEKITPTHTMPPWQTDARVTQHPVHNEADGKPHLKRYHKRGSSWQTPYKINAYLTSGRLCNCIHWWINEGTETRTPNGGRMGTILERIRKEEQGRRFGKTSQSIQCWDVGSAVRAENNNWVPTRATRSEQEMIQDCDIQTTQQQ